jgi:hypothetical protein
LIEFAGTVIADDVEMTLMCDTTRKCTSGWLKVANLTRNVALEPDEGGHDFFPLLRSMVSSNPYFEPSCGSVKAMRVIRQPFLANNAA